MNILILGGGGREHALAWAVRQNPRCDRLIVAPGNAGIAAVAECAALDILDGAAVAEFAAANAVDLVIVGPEAPLAAGVADDLRAAGLAVFGPSAAAARLEASKGFARELCAGAGVPQPRFARVRTLAQALDWLRAEGAPVVVKADGLAAGKGVTVAATLAEAEAAAEALFADGAAEVVLEECLKGEEASFFVLCDGAAVLPVGSAQDHKRAFDGDRGPNTGGMGAYSPAPVLTPALEAQVMARIVGPTVAAMAARGTPFSGVLYAGLMIHDGEARLIEYNVRFGDPEAQVLMLRLGGQALDLIEATARGELAQARVNWADDHALCVVMAARGYPGPYAKGSTIRGLQRIDEDSTQVVFHAGTLARDGAVLADGGRVLGISARGASLREARDRAYGVVDAIDWPEGFCRRDIGWRALGQAAD